MARSVEAAREARCPIARRTVAGGRDMGLGAEWVENKEATG